MALTESGLLVITIGCFLFSITNLKTFSRNLIFLLFLLSFLFSSSVSADVYDGQMSPLEAVVLNAMMTGSSVLNLRAHFLNRLPDLSSLAGMLTHLNLSFNDLWVSMTLVTAWCFFNARKQPKFRDTPPLISPAKWRLRIPYWWRVTTQIWVVLLTGQPVPISQSEALPISRQWHVVSMKFLHSLIRRHFAGKTVVASKEVGCFLRKSFQITILKLKSMQTPIWKTLRHCFCILKFFRKLFRYR